MPRHVHYDVVLKLACYCVLQCILQRFKNKNIAALSLIICEFPTVFVLHRF